jgi:hypothetical protein
LNFRQETIKEIAAKEKWRHEFMAFGMSMGNKIGWDNKKPGSFPERLPTIERAISDPAEKLIQQYDQMARERNQVPKTPVAMPAGQQSQRIMPDKTPVRAGWRAGAIKRAMSPRNMMNPKYQDLDASKLTNADSRGY